MNKGFLNKKKLIIFNCLVVFCVLVGLLFVKSGYLMSSQKATSTDLNIPKAVMGSVPLAVLTNNSLKYLDKEVVLDQVSVQKQRQQSVRQWDV